MSTRSKNFVFNLQINNPAAINDSKYSGFILHALFGNTK